MFTLDDICFSGAGTASPYGTTEFIPGFCWVRDALSLVFCHVWWFCRSFLCFVFVLSFSFAWPLQCLYLIDLQRLWVLWYLQFLLSFEEISKTKDLKSLRIKVLPWFTDDIRLSELVWIIAPWFPWFISVVLNCDGRWLTVCNVLMSVSWFGVWLWLCCRRLVSKSTYWFRTAWWRTCICEFRPKLLDCDNPVDCWDRLIMFVDRSLIFLFLALMFHTIAIIVSNTSIPQEKGTTIST